MLSVCIPVYCYPVRPLVEALLQQMDALKVPVELRIYDDGSPGPDQQRNRPLAALDRVVYRELPTNVGRAAIRNRLAQEASYEFLLFLDADSYPPDAHFLARYCAALPLEGLLYGGRCYVAEPPTNLDHSLHWHYGSVREVRTAVQRRKQPYHGFMTNNYVVSRVVQLQFPFEERLRQYGHEDTLFGLQLRAAGVPLHHIENPLLHLGLEPREVFLRKQQQAIENLWWLRQQYPEIDSRLLRQFDWLRRWGGIGAFRRMFGWLEPWLVRQLNGETPNLWALDVLKIHWLTKESRGDSGTSTGF